MGKENTTNDEREQQEKEKLKFIVVKVIISNG